MIKKVLIAAVAIGIVIAAGVYLYLNSRAQGEPIDDAQAAGLTSADFPMLKADVFQLMDGGIALTPEEIMGRNTWNLWTAGSQLMLDRMASESYGIIDILKVLDSRNRGTRFKDAGLINEPGFEQATKPDEYGLWIDVPAEGGPKTADQQIAAEGINERVYGKSTGILGLRLFPNPKFDDAAQKKWDDKRFYEDAAYFTDPGLVRPYVVGMTCGLCHISHHPLHPPANLEEPGWENLASIIGNQYFNEGSVFSSGLKPGDFLWEMVQAQPRGTSDTSRIATDHINNPNAINALFNLSGRIAAAGVNDQETIEEAARLLPGDKSEHKHVPHILKDGADSVGVPGATIRVYVNIGLFSQQWLELHNPLVGVRPQKPFEVAKAQRNSTYWRATEERLESIAKFFGRVGPMKLAEAPGGSDFIDATKLNQGKLVFAQNCAQCHSSKQPTEGMTWEELVQGDDFLDGNFLSDERRYPVTEIGTNSARALGTNATRGHIWDNFSSATYKSLKSVGTISVYNPVDPATPREFTAPDGGPGYYRTPSLIGIWSSAPFLHNNALGKFTGDSSVRGRLEAFDDAVEKLLWPDKRLNLDSIWKTSGESNIQIPKSAMPLVIREVLAPVLDKDGFLRIGPIPTGTPINALANVNLGLDALSGEHIKNIAALVVTLKATLLKTQGMDANEATALMKRDVLPLLLQSSKCPDLVEDRGHEFGADLSDDDKRALIEYLKCL